MSGKISDIVVEPVKGTGHGIVKGAEIGGKTGAAVGAVTVAGVSLIPAAIIGAAGTVAGLVGGLALGAGVLASIFVAAPVVGFLAWGATELAGATLGAGVGGATWGATGAVGGGAVGLVAGTLKGIKGWTEGVFNTVFGDKKKGDSAEVKALRGQDAATDAQLAYLTQQQQMQAESTSRRQDIAQTQATVANPDAPCDNASKVAEAQQVRITISPSM